MDAKGKRNLIIGLVVLGIAGIGYLIYKKKKSKEAISEGASETSVVDETSISLPDTSTGSTQTGGVSEPTSNYSALKYNLGANKKVFRDRTQVKFNNFRNIADFFTNNRVIIYNNNGKVIKKGSYSKGGKTIKLDNGKVITSGSVWGNLLNTLK
ncbi:MAG: hypothetical protein ACFFKA_19845 [Candidatus Thorarchaeota archaeon]